MSEDEGRPTPAQIAHELSGTCKSLEEVLDRHNAVELEDDKEFCLALDAIVFCCEQCNWWLEQSEMAERDDDRWICEDCTNDHP